MGRESGGGARERERSVRDGAKERIKEWDKFIVSEKIKREGSEGVVG